MPHCGNAEVEPGQGRSSRNPTSLHFLVFFPKPRALSPELFFLSLPSLRPIAFGSGFPFLAHLARESTFFFSLKVILRRKQKALLSKADCYLATRASRATEAGTCGAAAQPRVWPQTQFCVATLHERSAFDCRSPRMTLLCISRASQAFYGSNLIARQCFPDL